MKRYSKEGYERRKKSREGYSEFFEKHTSRARNSLCQECGRRLNGHVSEIAHILPKNVFKSIAVNDNNVLYLCSNFRYGADGCHDIYDSTWANAKKMKVWKIAVEKFKLLEEEIEESNYKILNHFYDNVKRDTKDIE